MTSVGLGDFGEQMVRPALERALTRAKVDRIRAHFEGAERILILMQDDPDPDALASALALKTLLGRTKAGAIIGTFGMITRPENRAMARLLDIDVEQVKPRALAEYLFDDDPFVKADLKQKASGLGTFSPVLKLTRDSNGILRGVRDIKLERCSRNCTGK